MRQMGFRSYNKEVTKTIRFAVFENYVLLNYIKEIMHRPFFFYKTDT